MEVAGADVAVVVVRPMDQGTEGVDSVCTAQGQWHIVPTCVGKSFTG